MENKGDIPVHPLIKRMKDQGVPVDATRIIEGFVGPAGQDENIRIYFDLTFTSYFETAKVDVVHVESSDDDESKPARIWIKKSAKLEIVTVQRVSTEAAFLQGSLTNRLGSFQRAMVGSQDLAPSTRQGCTEAGCASSLDICGTSYETGCYFPSDRGCADTLYGPACREHDPCTGGFPRTVGRSPARPC
jgi:hypothetical protein